MSGNDVKSKKKITVNFKEIFIVVSAKVLSFYVTYSIPNFIRKKLTVNIPLHAPAEISPSCVKLLELSAVKS